MSVYLIHFNLCTPVSNSVCIDEMIMHLKHKMILFC